MLDAVRRTVARLLAPEPFRDQERFERLMSNLIEVKDACSYDFPTAVAVVDWVTTSVTEPPRELLARRSSVSVDELKAWLRREYGDCAEPTDIALRLRRALDDAVVETICNGDEGWRGLNAPTRAARAAKRLRRAYERLARRQPL